jgi:hypothetical protein
MDLGTGIAAGTLILGISGMTGTWLYSKPPTNGNSPVTKSQCAKQHIDLEKLVDTKFQNLNEKIDMLLKHSGLI